MQAIYLYSRAILVGMVFSSAPACGDDAPPLGEGVAEIGTGALRFDAIADGEPLDLVPGTQGGHHFVVNARMQSLLPGNSSVPNELGNPLTSFIIINGEGERIEMPAPPYRLGYRESDEAPWLELPSGRILRVNQDLIDADPEFLDNLYVSEVTLRVTVIDARGEEASHERRVRPRAVEDQVPVPDAGP